MRNLKDDNMIIPPRKDPIWVRWSMEQHTEDEIRDAILNHPELVCFSYICRYSQMSEEFIENELIVLGTGIFTGYPEYYTKENIEFIRSLLFIEPTGDRLNAMRFKLMNSKLYCKNLKSDFIGYLKTVHTPIRTKIDWWQIACYQNGLSKEFRKKFAKNFKEAKAAADRPVENVSSEDLKSM